MTPLRQRMLEDMSIRNLAENTKLSYLQQVSLYANHFHRSPEILGPKEVRDYRREGRTSASFSTLSWFMLALTQFGSTTVLSLLCAGIAVLALARQRRRLAATFLLALAGTGLVSATLKALLG